MRDILGQLRDFGRLAAAGLRYALARVLLLALIILINPFGSVTASDDHSRDIWERLYAELYAGDRMSHGPLIGKEAAGREASTVILLGAPDWEALAAGRQPDSRDVARVVDQITSRTTEAPRAIFIDMGLGYFAPEGWTTDELSRPDAKETATCRDPSAEIRSPFRCLILLISERTGYKDWPRDRDCNRNTVARLECIRKAKGIPILLADMRSRGAPVSEAARIGFEALAEVAVLVPADYLSPTAYPMVEPPRAGLDPELSYRLYPAAAMYAAYCMPGAPTTCAPVPFLEPDTNRDAPAWRHDHWGWSPAFANPGAIVWGIGSHSKFADLMVDVSGVRQGVNCRVAAGLKGTAVELARASASGIKVLRMPACLYPRVLTYRQAIRLSPRLAQAAVGGRILIIGDASATADDFVDTALHGPVNGPIWHAMALDNLISFGADYPQAPRELPGLTLNDHDLANLGAAALILLPGGFLVVWARRRNSALPDSALPDVHEWALRILALALALAAMALIVFLMVGRFSAIPQQYNYAALTIVVLVQLAAIAAVILRPLWAWLVARSRLLAFFVDEAPHAPVRRRRKAVGTKK